LFFSRSSIPFNRDGVVQSQFSLKHLGMYGYQKSFLEEFICLPEGELEKLEKLEQLRALENGKRISVEVVTEGSAGVDTEEDLSLLAFE
jgi:3-deoxy-manno-octulosonate cytidylyltransferase (CMP-KDO synthetase)